MLNKVCIFYKNVRMHVSIFYFLNCTLNDTMGCDSFTNIVNFHVYYVYKNVYGHCVFLLK